jgi:hypothetical protein
LERSDNVADSHAFAVLKRGYTRRMVNQAITETLPLHESSAKRR